MRRTLAGLIAVLLAVLLLPAGAAPASVGQPRVVSEDPADWTPDVLDGGGVKHSAVHAFAQRRGTMYAGGQFHRVASGSGDKRHDRTNLMAFERGTGKLTSFAPRLNGAVAALEARGKWLYVAGSFTRVDGVARRGVARLDARTGAVDRSFNARLTSGKVNDIELVGKRLYLAGSFGRNLVVVKPDTGKTSRYLRLRIRGSVASNAGQTDVLRFAINPARTRLVAVGNFTSVAGEARKRAFMLTLGSGSARLTRWYYQPFTNMCRGDAFPAYLRDVDFSPNGNYFVVVATGATPVAGGVGRDVCDAAARFQTKRDRPSRPVWINYTGGDTLLSVAATGAAVYVQGHQRWLDNPKGRNDAGPGAVRREGIGAIHSRTGKALPWNPGKTRGIGGKVLYATKAGLWVGSDGARFAGEYRDNIAFCPL
ncbi:MAG TPA: hypothetical protein VK365_07905 [Nocardioidaceae bacterium]|nr:hypothetical protein [Nocardioidaceae bacterium]